MSADFETDAQALRRRYPRGTSALIPILHLWQARAGYVSEEGIERTAQVMQLPPAYVESVLTFYTLFRRTPTGRYRIQVCKNLSCMLAGADEVIAHLAERLGIEPGETTPDGLITLEAVECLAACDEAPAAQVNFRWCPRLTREAADQLLDALERADEEVARRYG